VKLRDAIGAVFVIAASAVCVRLGFWQLERLHEKQALNSALRAALARPPLALSDPFAVPAGAVRGRRVRLRGVFDERRQILLAGRAHDGSPGVSAVTPLVLDGGARAVLVERGWLYADDASTAHPERYPEPGPRAVIGIAEPLAGGRGGPPMRAVPSDSAKLWSVRWLDRDSLAPRLPYALAGFVVRQLPGEGIPGRPLRLPPRAYDETMHLSYAIQWFLFAAILLGGSTILAFTRRRDGAEIRPERSP